MTRRGELASQKLGRRVLIPISEVLRVFGVEVPPDQIQAFNPVFILILLPLITLFIKYLETRGFKIRPTGKLSPFNFDGKTGAEIHGNLITLHFIDGARGDTA